MHLNKDIVNTPKNFKERGKQTHLC